MSAPQLTLAQAVQHVAVLRQQGKTIALANGAFDLLHVGHLRYLQAARGLCDWLLVAINEDASVRRAKGATRPVVPQNERAELVAALRCVDAVCLFAQDTVTDVIAAICPDVHAKGTDYTVDSVPEAALVQSLGGRVAIVGDAKDHSTSATVLSLAQLANKGSL